MPELTAVHIGLLVVVLLVGATLGWIFRSDRCAKEKIAVNAGWQKELESQRVEHDRLAEQSKSLMEQISQYQASQKDYSNRARELSESLKEAFAQRDQLQRQLRDIRGNLEVAIAQRDKFQRSLQDQQSNDQSAALKEKDDKIFRLSRELTSWQSRVPPLVERFQAKNREAQELAEELEEARREVARLEELTRFDQTRIEPLDTDTLPDGGNASNEPIAMTAAHDSLAMYDDAEAEDETDEDEADAKEIADVGDHAAPDAGEAEAVDTAEDDEAENPESPDTAKAEDPDAPVAHEAESDTVQVAGDDADDLKLIKGIGPSIEKTLNDLGIHSFQQIADMSEYEIDRVAQHLRGFRSRIYREDWIGQARDLHYDKSNQRH